MKRRSFLGAVATITFFPAFSFPGKTEPYVKKLPPGTRIFKSKTFRNKTLMFDGPVCFENCNFAGECDFDGKSMFFEGPNTIEGVLILRGEVNVGGTCEIGGSGTLHLKGRKVIEKL